MVKLTMIVTIWSRSDAILCDSLAMNRYTCTVDLHFVPQLAEFQLMLQEMLFFQVQSGFLPDPCYCLPCRRFRAPQYEVQVNVHC
jgi:hypothetical protein